MSRTASNKVIHQGFAALEQELIKHFSPIVSMLNKLILQEIDPSTLVSEGAGLDMIIK